MKESHKRSRNPKVKAKYKVKNRAHYEQLLRNRVNLSLLLSAKAIKFWKSKSSGKRGVQRVFLTWIRFCALVQIGMGIARFSVGFLKR